MRIKTTYGLCIIFLLLMQCSSDDENIHTEGEVSAQITSFQLLKTDNATLSEDVTATIDHDKKVIILNLPKHITEEKFLPHIRHSKGTEIFPSIKLKRSFREPATYSVINGANLLTIKYTVKVVYK